MRIAIIRHKTTGDRFTATIDGDEVVALSVPMHHSETEAQQDQTKLDNSLPLDEYREEE